MNNKRNVSLVLFSFLLLFSISTNAQDAHNVSCINQYYHNWQDGIFNVCVQGDYAYLACLTDGLRIVNIGEPGEFYDVGRLLIDNAKEIAVSGDYAYLYCTASGINVIDVSNPESPQVVTTIELNDYINAITIVGDYAFIASRQGLAIVDVSNPESPQVLWHSTDIYETTDIEIHGNLAYAACNSQGMYEIDITDVTSPQVVNTYYLTSGEYVTGASVSGNYAYLSCGWDGFQVVDLTTMEMVAQIDSFDYAFDVDVVDGFAYMLYGDPDCPLAIIDISDPLSPQTTSIYYPPLLIYSYQIVGDIAYVADYNHGLRLVDISDPYNPHETEIYSRYGHDLDVTISGNYAYVREYFKLKVIDITDLQNPVELGFYESNWGYNDLKVVGDVGYLTQRRYNCLSVVDLANPDAPIELGAYTAPDSSESHYRMEVYGNYGYMGEHLGIRILDLSDPTNIQDAGYYECDIINNSRLMIHDHYLFVRSAYLDLSFTVLDLADPLSPSVVCGYEIERNINDMVVSEGILYAVTDRDLYTFDATSFDQWEPLAEVNIFAPSVDYIKGIDVYNKYAYITPSHFGLYVYDVTDCTDPQQVGYYRTPGSSGGVAAMGEIAIVADLDNLGFYDCSDAFVGIEDAEPSIPSAFSLLPNYPNPFNASTRIQFEMPRAGHVTLTVFDLLGQNVSTLANRKFEAGTHSLIWKGAGRDGQKVASGRYYIQARTGDTTEKMPVTLLK
ncbi:MAG: T9SS type A sorting domain-containing protein [candidate division Zixibacteria bacterium]|nr:T9SS type A sorting domain-containing protein [candidate division Zixibacteria bacterium]